jgi:hypothetical protein
MNLHNFEVYLNVFHYKLISSEEDGDEQDECSSSFMI